MLELEVCRASQEHELKPTRTVGNSRQSLIACGCDDTGVLQKKVAPGTIEVNKYAPRPEVGGAEGVSRGGWSPTPVR